MIVHGGIQEEEEEEKEPEEENLCSSDDDVVCVDPPSPKRVKLQPPDDDIDRAPPADLRISCHFCFDRFDRESEEFRHHLLDHLEVYSGKTICPECRVDCETNDKMVDHFLMAHGKLKKYVCELSTCVRTFRTKKSLEFHARKHNEQMNKERRMK